MKFNILRSILKPYWLELLVIGIIIMLFISYPFIPDYIMIIGFLVPLIIFLMKSLKENSRKKRINHILLKNIEEIFKDIHFFQKIPDMNERIFEKFNNLNNNFEKELKEINCFVEEIENSKALVIYLKDEKIIAKPGQQIIKQSKSRGIQQSIQDLNDIENLMKEIEQS